MRALNIDVCSPFDLMSKETCRVFNWINRSLEKHMHDSEYNKDECMCIELSVKTIVDDQKVLKISNSKELYPDYIKEIVKRRHLIKKLYELKGWTVKFSFNDEMGSFGDNETDMFLFSYSY